MKVLEFKTSKGRFVLVDNPLLPQAMSITTKYIKLSEITEEQANDIVDKVMNNQHFQNYDFKEVTDRWTKSAIESLHSLLKSKGVHLFRNTYLDYETLNIDAIKAEQKTFYNPFIYKL